MSKTAPKQGVPTRDFTDAGTGEAFTAGEPHDFEPGIHANYIAAGLIAEPKTTASAKPGN